MPQQKSNFRERFEALKSLPDSSFPTHLFIIPDGNRRYAKANGKPTFWGHQKGFDVMVQILRNLKDLPITVVGFWGFSADNWKRDEKEISALMRIFARLIDNYIDEIHQDNRRFIHIGRRDRLPQNLVKKIEAAEEKTRNNSGQIVCLALDFGGEDQNVRMIEKARTKDKDLEMNEENLWQLRDSQGIVRSADLIFRTSETRTSDVGWINGKHSVLYFLPDKLFPQISEQEIVNSIVFYSKTKRNEGK